MKTSIKSVYKCDHCGKNYLVKSACERHEPFCPQRPKNKHKCFQGCEHLIKGTEQYTTEHSGYQDGYVGVNRVTFQCAKTLQFMYSFKAERLGIVPTYNDYDAAEENRQYTRMPLECDLYEDRMKLPF